MLLWTLTTSLLLLAALAKSNVVPEPYSDSWTDEKHHGGKPVPLNGDPETSQLEGEANPPTEPADGQSSTGALPDPSWRLIGPADVYWQTESPPPLDPLIVGGKPAPKNKVPSMVSIQILYLGNVYHICGGSLVAPNKVLTAAHCNEQFGAFDFQVGLGYHYISKGLQNPNSQVIKVIAAEDHSYHMKGYIGGDIGVITLEKNAQIKPGYVEIMKLSTLQSVDFVGKNAFLVGWGKTNFSEGLSDELKYLEFEVLPDVDCKQEWSFFWEKESFCAKGNLGVSCNGDSGGPLIHSITKEQIGLVAYGYRYCYIHKPAVFTTVGFYHQNWIKKRL